MPFTEADTLPIVAVGVPTVDQDGKPLTGSASVARPAAQEAVAIFPTSGAFGANLIPGGDPKASPLPPASKFLSSIEQEQLALLETPQDRKVAPVSAVRADLSVVFSQPSLTGTSIHRSTLALAFSASADFIFGRPFEIQAPPASASSDDDLKISFFDMVEEKIERGGGGYKREDAPPKDELISQFLKNLSGSSPSRVHILLAAQGYATFWEDVITTLVATDPTSSSDFEIRTKGTTDFVGSRRLRLQVARRGISFLCQDAMLRWRLVVLLPPPTPLGALARYPSHLLAGQKAVLLALGNALSVANKIVEKIGKKGLLSGRTPQALESAKKAAQAALDECYPSCFTGNDWGGSLNALYRIALGNYSKLCDYPTGVSLEVYAERLAKQSLYSKNSYTAFRLSCLWDGLAPFDDFLKNQHSYGHQNRHSIILRDIDSPFFINLPRASIESDNKAHSGIQLNISFIKIEETEPGRRVLELFDLGGYAAEAKTTTDVSLRRAIWLSLRKAQFGDEPCVPGLVLVQLWKRPDGTLTLAKVTDDITSPPQLLQTSQEKPVVLELNDFAKSELASMGCSFGDESFDRTTVAGRERWVQSRLLLPCGPETNLGCLQIVFGNCLNIQDFDKSPRGLRLRATTETVFREPWERIKLNLFNVINRAKDPAGSVSKRVPFNEQPIQRILGSMEPSPHFPVSKRATAESFLAFQRMRVYDFHAEGLANLQGQRKALEDANDAEADDFEATLRGPTDDDGPTEDAPRLTEKEDPRGLYWMHDQAYYAEADEYSDDDTHGNISGGE